MTLRDFLKNAGSIKKELLDKEIVIQAENGLFMTPTIKFMKKDNGDLSFSTENIDKLIITVE